jgi:hypothetical protein
MQHEGYVTTALQSPNGRVASASGTWLGQGHSRADVYLPFASNDLGTYTVSSYHSAYCAIMGWFILQRLTQSSTTVPYVLLALQTSGTIPDDNAGKTAFNNALGTTTLGTRYYSTQAYWGTGVQIVGTVYPTDLADSITIRREVREDKIFQGNTLYQQTAPPIYDDTSPANLRDDYPLSGGSAHTIYDLDAPGIADAPVGTILRMRTNFREWAVLNSKALVVSPIDLYWYSRVSIIGTSTGDQLKTDVPGDNVAGVGQTKTTWNLQ